MGSTDHCAVLSTIRLRGSYEEGKCRTSWQWEKGEWNSVREILNNLPFERILSGDIDYQASRLNGILTELQIKFVPHKVHSDKPTDQPWFGTQCRVAADAKKHAWRIYKRRPSVLNKRLLKNACKRMKTVQKWAIRRWE